MLCSSNFWFIIESKTGVWLYAAMEGYANPKIPLNFPAAKTSPFSFKISPNFWSLIWMLPSPNWSELISPAISPVPKATSTPKPTFFQVEDLFLLKEMWEVQESSLHKEEVTQRFALPVSKITGITCLGVPIAISPTYCVFL